MMNRPLRTTAVKMIIVIGMVGLLLILRSLPGVGASDVEVASDGIDLAYVLSIDDPASGQARVTITASNIPGDTFQVEQHGYHGIYIEPQGFSARDAAGNILPVEYFPDSGSTFYNGQRADVWRVQNGGQQTVIIEYSVKPGLLDPGHGYRGYIAPDFAAMAGEYVFLVPLGNPVFTIRVKFDLPEGWIVYASWNKVGDLYDPALPNTNIIRSLSISDFAVGQFDVKTKRIGSTETAVAAYDAWPAAVKNDLAEKSWEILEYQTEIFGGSVGDYYLTIFTPTAPDGQDIYVGEWSTSQGYSIRFADDGSYWGKWDMYAHQTYHRWNSWAWGMHGYGSWFTEGPNVLYEQKTITELRIERPYGNMEDELRRYTEIYINEYVNTGKDQSLVYGNLDSFLLYCKGALASFLMAKEIYLRTDGQHNFDDFLELLVQKYGYYQGACPESCLIAELDALTGTDFKPFFDAYIYGTTPLPMSWAFEDSDADGLSNTLEIGWDTHPEKKDTDGDGHSDAAEIAAHTDPLDEGSFPYSVYMPVVLKNFGDPTLPIKVDGEGEDWDPFTPYAEDYRGDTQGGPDTDLKAIYVEKDAYHTFIMIEVYGPPAKMNSTIE